MHTRMSPLSAAAPARPLITSPSRASTEPSGVTNSARSFSKRAENPLGHTTDLRSPSSTVVNPIAPLSRSTRMGTTSAIGHPNPLGGHSLHGCVSRASGVAPGGSAAGRGAPKQPEDRAYEDSRDRYHYTNTKRSSPPGHLLRQSGHWLMDDAHGPRLTRGCITETGQSSHRRSPPRPSWSVHCCSQQQNRRTDSHTGAVSAEVTLGRARRLGPRGGPGVRTARHVPLLLLPAARAPTSASGRRAGAAQTSG